MSESIKGNWTEAYSVWLGTDDLDDNIDMISAFADIILVIANLTTCESREPYRDVRDFCKAKWVSDADDLAPEDEGESRCSFGSILTNLSKNVFVLMGKAGSISELY